MRRLALAIGAIACLLNGVAVGAVEAPRPPKPEPLALGRLERPPVIDGSLGEAEWDGAGKLSLDYQTEPGDNTPASERTEVRVGRDRTHLYVAFRAWDSDPSGIRARVVRRDDIDNNDDFVTLFLDTDGSRQRAYRLRFNPMGVQQDGIFTENETGDFSWDGIFEAKGTLVPDGYVVEVAVPFKTLRFQSGPDASWGLHLFRWIARKAERISWQPISRDNSGLIVQMASVTGLDDIYVGRTLDLVPTLVGSSVETRIADPPNAAGSRLDGVQDAAPGLTAIWSFTPSLTLSGALNPDFSQVEADVPQITVNQRFPLFYDEKRPFFLEGAEGFAPINPRGFKLLDTRTIVDPDWGTKLTGRVGKTTLGVLVTSDAAGGLSSESGQGDYGKNAYLGVFKLQRDLFKDSAVGFGLAERRIGAFSNTALSVESRLRLRQVNTVGLQAVATRSAAEGKTQHGFASRMSWNTYARAWRIYFHDEYVSPDYEAQAGFIQRTDYHESSGEVGYEFRNKKAGSWWIYIWPYEVLLRSRTTAGQLEFEYADSAVEILFPRGILLNYWYSFDHDGFAGQTFRYQFQSLRLKVERFKRVSYSGKFQIGQGLLYDTARPQVGDVLQLEQALSIRPNSRITSAFLFLKSRTSDPATALRLSSQDILRNRTAFQFSKRHAARSIVEYDTSVDRLGVSLLYSFTPRPNTALYVGYNDLLFADVDPVTDRPRRGMVRQQRVFFIKLSYNWRL